MAELDNKLNDPLNTKPKAEKTSGMPGPSQAFKEYTEASKKQEQAEKDLAAAKAKELREKPAIEAELLKAQKEYRGEQRKTYEQEVESAKQDMANFKVSQDSIGGMSALGTGILMLGQLLGKTGGQQSAMGAIQGMTGMMEGYTKGRADEFKRNQIEFERNFKILQDKIKQANDKLQAALAEMPYNTIEAETKAKLALAELGSDILIKTGDIQGYKVVSDRLKEAFNGSLKLAELARKQGVSSGSKSAINERFQNTVIRSANETLRSLELMENIGIDIGKGAFGGVVGKGTATSEAIANITRAMTSQDQLRYNAAAGGMALELAYVMNGGYKPNETQITELKNLYLATPQDTYETAAFKFADVVAKLRAALEVAPAYTPEQKQNNQMLLEKINRYATPEEILRKISGQEPQRDPYVRTSGGKTETRRGKVTSGPNAGKTKIEYSDGTSEYVNE